MRKPPVVAVLRSPFSRLAAAILLWLTASAVYCQSPEPVQPHRRYVAAIELHTAQELYNALDRVAKLPRKSFLAPVEFILHGPEVHSLLGENYADNRQLVDLAARLSAFEVVDIKVCERWAGGALVDLQDLPPFIGTVRFGAGEIQRLMREENYVYF